MGVAMMAVMHLYFNFTQPLFIQALMGIKNLYDAKPVKIYIFGQKAEGELKRPFKSASMFGGMFRYSLSQAPLIRRLSCQCRPSNRRSSYCGSREACWQEGGV